MAHCQKSFVGGRASQVIKWASVLLGALGNCLEGLRPVGDTSYINHVPMAANQTGLDLSSQSLKDNQHFIVACNATWIPKPKLSSETFILTKEQALFYPT